MVDITPLHPRPEVVDFLMTRRSRPAKTLLGPGPSRAELEQFLTAAARSPDHGKLEPWRFVVLEGAALQRLTTLARARAEVIAPDKVEKIAAMFENAPCLVAVVSAPQPSDKIPEVEQTLSAGAVCLALCNAAQASGWGANWLSGVMAYDQVFLSEALDLPEGQWVAGYIVIGREGPLPPERPRPDLARITRWVSE